MENQAVICDRRCDTRGAEQDENRAVGPGPEGLAIHERQPLGTISTDAMHPSCTLPVHAAPLNKINRDAPVHKERVQVLDFIEGRLPAFVRDMQLQRPAAAVFSVHDLEWECIVDNKHYLLVTAIPKDRVADFRAGEALRGMTKVLQYPKRACSKGMAVDDQAVCKFGPVKPAIQKVRQNMLASSTPHTDRSDAKARRGKNQMRKGCKMGCTYGFVVKRYQKAADVAILKFSCE
eukprot:jgi/Ulvmu1/1404/UM011_0132.1